MKRFAIKGALLAIAATAALASPIQYPLTFSLTNGAPNTASGSYTYDAALPIGAQFTSFHVTWDGFTFDLAQSANSPQHSGNDGGCPSSPTSATFFAMLQGAPQCGANDTKKIEWAADAFDSESLTYFTICDTTDSVDTPCFGGNSYSTMYLGVLQPYVAPPNSNAVYLAGGTVNSQQSATPEPSTFALTLAGLAVLARFTRTVQKLRQPVPAAAPREVARLT
jgi:hypothetical protein